MEKPFQNLTTAVSTLAADATAFAETLHQVVLTQFNVMEKLNFYDKNEAFAKTNQALMTKHWTKYRRLLQKRVIGPLSM